MSPLSHIMALSILILASLVAFTASSSVQHSQIDTKVSAQVNLVGFSQNMQNFRVEIHKFKFERNEIYLKALHKLKTQFKTKLTIQALKTQ